MTKVLFTTEFTEITEKLFRRKSSVFSTVRIFLFVSACFTAVGRLAALQ